MQLTTPEARATLQAIPSGVAGVRETLRQMSALVQQGKTSMPIRTLALNIVKGLPPKAWKAEVEAVYNWVLENIRFVKDVRGVETLATPQKTLEFGQGDCDDQATLIAALLESIGHPTRFVAMGFSPSHYSHVFTETKIGDSWVSLETTVIGAYMGWSPPGIRAKMIYVN
jgi:transglutaminase-like putative cysteine protease